MKIAPRPRAVVHRQSSRGAVDAKHFIQSAVLPFNLWGLQATLPDDGGSCSVLFTAVRHGVSLVHINASVGWVGYHSRRVGSLATLKDGRMRVATGQKVSQQWEALETVIAGIYIDFLDALRLLVPGR